MKIFTSLLINLLTVTTRSLAMTWLAISTLLLTGCKVEIQTPADQASITAPSTVDVNVGLPFLYSAGTFRARLNEKDITSQFNVNSQNGVATFVGLSLAPSKNQLDVDACNGFNNVIPIIGSSFFCFKNRATFTVVPLITKVSPATGQPGTVVNVNGAGFVVPVSVKFGTTQPISSITPTNNGTQLSATVPQGLVPGVTPVIVTSNGQNSAPLNFTVTSPPL